MGTSPHFTLHARPLSRCVPARNCYLPPSHVTSIPEITLRLREVTRDCNLGPGRHKRVAERGKKRVLLYTTAGLAWIRQTGREWCPLECRIVSPCGANLLDYLVRSLHVDGHHSRPFRRLSTIPAVLDISILPFPRSIIQMQCQKSTWRSRVSSSELDMISHIEIVRAHLSSREIAMLTSDTAFE